MAPTAKSKTPQPSCGITWRPTKIMNMRDLSKDDDFLSHLLVEKLGTGTVPLLVHKMDPTRRLPKVDAAVLLDIVKRVRTSSFKASYLSVV
jgi:[histone H4]-N-methyl-L-lysine20 N-methyltransferase